MERPAPTRGSCALCAAPARLQCCACRGAWYCTKAHQKEHWGRHRGDCASYTVRSDAVLGRHLVATRNIRRGDVIVCEPPLVVGPKLVTAPVCLGCHRLLEAGGGTVPCPGCGWPLCAHECAQFPCHVPECQLMQERGYHYGGHAHAPKMEAAYSAIAPLRCLLLQHQHADKYDALLQLQSHLQVRRASALYDLLAVNVCGFIHSALRLHQHDADAILRMAAILDTNSFEVRRGRQRARAVYRTLSLLSHDCTPNTRHVVLDDACTMALVATVAIPKDGLITATYTHTLWDTATRRTHLRATKCFDCTCRRCADPTELGSMVGVVRCPACAAAALMATRPLEAAAAATPWCCRTCGHEEAAASVLQTAANLRRQLDAVDKTRMENLEEFLVRHAGVLGPSSSISVQVKFALCQGYGNVRGYALQDLTEGQLTRKADLCKELLALADLLDPGDSPFRGRLLYELHLALATLAQRSTHGRERATRQALEALEEAAWLLRDDAEMASEAEGRLQVLRAQL